MVYDMINRHVTADVSTKTNMRAGLRSKFNTAFDAKASDVGVGK